MEAARAVLINHPAVLLMDEPFGAFDALTHVELKDPRSGERLLPWARHADAGAEPVGRFALQLLFRDGHDRGFYPWDWLRNG